jgi:hypothetical protein
VEWSCRGGFALYLFSLLVCFVFRLKRFERFGILNSRQYDPMEYMMYLEPAGFENVKVGFLNILSVDAI